MWYLDNINVVDSKEAEQKAKKRESATKYEEYFSSMVLGATQLRRRIQMAKELEEALFLLFLAWFYEADEDEAESTFINTYLDTVEQYDDVGLEDEFTEYVILLAALLRESTMRAKAEYEGKLAISASEIDRAESSIAVVNSLERSQRGRDAPYFASYDRATYVAANEANTALNSIEFAQAKRDGCTKKTWHTERDMRVRPTHVPHEGETIPIDDLFVVGGVRFRYPKDTYDIGNISWGRETANCRCVASYS